jgi:hypothetical protein
MSILNENSKKMLVESMRACVCDILKESVTLTAKQASDRSKFITESATYEQLLNITMNPDRDTKYLPSYVLEGAVAILHSACMTGRHKIGINAITEGAIKLQKETGAVITESMLDAALASVERGSGLKVIGKILHEVARPALDSTLSDMVRDVTSAGGWSKLTGSQRQRFGQILHGYAKSPSDHKQIIDTLNGGADPFKLFKHINARKTTEDAIKAIDQQLADPNISVDMKRALSARKSNLSKTLNKFAAGAGSNRIPSGVNARIFNAATNAPAKSGGSWQKALLYGGAGAAAALGGAYLWNRRNQNLANQQYDSQH